MKAISIWRPQRLAIGNLCVPTRTFFALFFVSLFAYPSAHAAYQTANIPYGLTYPEGSFNQGEAITIIIWAGDAQTSLEDVSGFDLTIKLTEHALFPNSISPDLSGSWIAEGGNLTTTTSLDQAASSITFHAVDSSLAESGYGEIARFTLICDGDGLTAQQLLSSSSGIIIQIDDFILRQGRPSTTSATSESKLYPNPSHGKVFLADAPEMIRAWRLLSMDGKEVGHGQTFPLDLRRLDIPTGIYFLLVQWKSLEQKSYRLDYRHP